MQKYTSAETSINSTKLPTTFTKFDFKRGTRNFDLGGGKFDNATDFLNSKGVENVIYDPFNRSREHNEMSVMGSFRNFDTCTCNNVLNVIDSLDEINNVIKRANFVLKPNGVVFFKIYEGDKTGIGKPTKTDCFQQNKKADWYKFFVGNFFEEVYKKGDIIIGVRPKNIVIPISFPTDNKGNYIIFH